MNEPKMETIEEAFRSQYEEIKVANSTVSKVLATQILRIFEQKKRVALSCIGAQAIAQAFKAVAIANGEAASQGVILAIVPSFDVKKLQDRDTNKEIELTAIRCVIARLPLIL